MEKTDIRSMPYNELKDYIKCLGQPSYRADQVFKWLHFNLADSFEEMSNIPRSLKEELSLNCEIKKTAKEDVLVSGIDGTRKYVFSLNDGVFIESVMMRYKHGNSVCVSSQAGCAMGCRFCATGLSGLKRDLNASEMLSQVYSIQKDTGERVSNIVIMGMGEPLLNYDNVVRFIRIISDENTLHISQRNITISTCGICPAILRLSNESLKCTLAVSLHAPTDEIRRKIMPIADKYSIRDIFVACDKYFEATGRRVTYEYCLIGGINDRKEHACKLAGLLKGRNAHVNVIPVNPVPEIDLLPSESRDTEQFVNVLEDAGIQVTRRREMGRDIHGACGQLIRRTV